MMTGDVPSLAELYTLGYCWCLFYINDEADSYLSLNNFVIIRDYYFLNLENLSVCIVHLVHCHNHTSCPTLTRSRSRSRSGSPIENEDSASLDRTRLRSTNCTSPAETALHWLIYSQEVARGRLHTPVQCMHK